MQLLEEELNETEVYIWLNGLHDKMFSFKTNNHYNVYIKAISK